MKWATLREAAAWDEYLREVETYAEEDLKEVALGWVEQGRARVLGQIDAIASRLRDVRSGLRCEPPDAALVPWLRSPGSIGSFAIELARGGAFRSERTNDALTGSPQGPQVTIVEPLDTVRREFAQQAASLDRRQQHEHAALRMRVVEATDRRRAAWEAADRELEAKLEALLDAAEALARDHASHRQALHDRFTCLRAQCEESGIAAVRVVCDELRRRGEEMAGHRMHIASTFHPEGSAVQREHYPSPRDLLDGLARASWAEVELAGSASASAFEYTFAGTVASELAALARQEAAELRRLADDFDVERRAVAAAVTDVFASRRALRSMVDGLASEFDELRSMASELDRRHHAERGALEARFTLEACVRDAASPQPRSGRELVEVVSASGPRWESNALLERTLGGQGAEVDHSAVTLQALVLAEGTLRTLLYAGAENILEHVICHGDDDAAYLTRIVSERRPMTWTALALWLRALERAVLADQEAVVDWLATRVGAAHAVANLGLASQWFGLRDLRNRLAHAEHLGLNRAEHADIMCTLLGATLDPWWRSPTSPRSPFTSVLDAHAQWRDSVLRLP